MLPDNVITLMWMLVFFVIFFIYIDVRLAKFRKEMLDHYMLCENILKMKTSSNEYIHSTAAKQPANSFVDAFGVTVINPGGISSDIDELVPTREELAQGIQTFNASFKNGNDILQRSITTNFCDPGWKDTVAGNSLTSNSGILGFDTGGNDYATVSF